MFKFEPTNFELFQHVKGIPYSLNIMTSFLSRNISFSGYSRNCSVGTRSVFLTQYVCFNSINIFRRTRCARHTNTMPFRLSADPVVSSFAINRFNDAINIFLGNSCKKLFGYVMLILSQNCDQTQIIFVENYFVALLKMSWRQNC